MTWAQGRIHVEQLIADGRVQRVEPNRGHSDRLIEMAERHLKTAGGSMWLPHRPAPRQSPLTLTSCRIGHDLVDVLVGAGDLVDERVAIAVLDTDH